MLISKKSASDNTIYRGLTQKEAAERLLKYGKNELQNAKKVPLIMLFINQFKDFITLILIGAALLSYLLGEVADAATILIIIVMNGILGFIQEFRTEKSLAALKELSAPYALVIRDNEEKRLPASEVVIGDVVLLEAGDRVCADCVLTEAIRVTVDEAILTGESVPVEKRAVYFNELESAQKENMLYMGTVLTMGRARAVVIKTGMQTEMGSIAGMLQSVDEGETPLKKRLDKIGKELVFICLGVCVLIIIAGIFHGETLYQMFLSGVSLAVAAIPEGLPAIVTVSLAIGVQRMLKRNALVRKLPAVETLGSINIICADKTGTLTENKMTVKSIYTDNTNIEISGNGYDLSGSFSQGNICYNDIYKEHSLYMLLITGALCNNAHVTGKTISGDPTEIAIMIASYKARLDPLSLPEYTRISELPFDSDRKRMSTLYKKDGDGYYLFVKGAPDSILPLCTQRLLSGKPILFAKDAKNQIMKTNEGMAGNALRVLAFAYKRCSLPLENAAIGEAENNLIFVGLEGMIDPPRREAAEAIKSCYKAGIRPIMITGDHKSTAVAVATELGMRIKAGSVLTGEELEQLSDRDLENKLQEIPVFARVAPRHKLRIVKALKRRKNIVAMTGDGVNDAPALKEADIGVAMGKNGTDVAKEASAMVLLDDNFATIVAAIEEGRMIYDNIRKFIRYLLACNLGEILMMGAAAFFGMPMPLIPTQILWVNLVTDGLPALALGVDPPEQGIMSRPPRKGDEGIFSKGLGAKIALSGLLIGGFSLLAFMLIMVTTSGNLSVSRTAAFGTMIIAELLYAFECRSEHKSVWEIGFIGNIYLLSAVLLSLAMMFMVIYVPFFSAIFKTVPLNIFEWLVVTGFGLASFFISSLIFKPTDKRI